MRGKSILIVIAIIVMAAALWWSQHRSSPPKISGFIEAYDIRVGSRVGGRVASVKVLEGQRIKAGEIMIELEPYDLKDRRAEAAANLAAKKADLLRLKNGPRPQEIAAAEAQVRFAQAQVQVTQATEKRVRASFEQKAVSADELDKAVADAQSAVASLDVRKQQLELLKVGTRPEEIAAAQAAVDATQANLAALDTQIGELTIKAPLDGTVDAVQIRPGDLVAANAPVLSITDTSHLWVRAFVPENHLNLQIGQKVTITVDSFPKRNFAAHISFVSTQAEFTPNNVQTPEERSKQVFRIKADLDEGLDVLRAGMAADVWIKEASQR